MNSLSDKVKAQQCPKHGSPYGFIYKRAVNGTVMMCDECITPQTKMKDLISLRKAYKFIEEQQILRDQKRLVITRLWQQFKHNSEEIIRRLRQLEELIEQILDSIHENQGARTLNVEGVTTQKNIEQIGQYLGNLIEQDSEGKLTLKQEQQVGQDEQQGFLQFNKLFEGMKKANDEFNQLLSLNQDSTVQNQNITQTKKEKTNSLAITNSIYEINQTIKLDNYCYCISLNYDKTQMVIACSNQIKLYSVSQQGQWIQQQFQLDKQEQFKTQVKFNYDSTLIALCGHDNQIIICSKQLNDKWIMQDKLSDPQKSIWSICFNHDSSLLASGCNDGTIYIHKISNGKCKDQQSINGHKSQVCDMCFNNDSTKLASGSADNSIIIWKLNNQEKWIILQTLQEHTATVKTLQFNSESNSLISSSYDRTIKIWVVDKYEKWKLSQTLTEHSNKVVSAYFNAQSNIIVSGSHDNSIKIWKKNNEGKWKCTQTIDNKHIVLQAIINSDSSMIISHSYDLKIQIYKPEGIQ